VELSRVRIGCPIAPYPARFRPWFRLELMLYVITVHDSDVELRVRTRGWWEVKDVNGSLGRGRAVYQTICYDKAKLLS